MIRIMSMAFLGSMELSLIQTRKRTSLYDKERKLLAGETIPQVPRNIGGDSGPATRRIPNIGGAYWAHFFASQKNRAIRSNKNPAGFYSAPIPCAGEHPRPCECSPSLKLPRSARQLKESPRPAEFRSAKLRKSPQNQNAARFGSASLPAGPPPCSAFPEPRQRQAGDLTNGGVILLFNAAIVFKRLTFRNFSL
jgi:hypothetical protein